jgi:protein-S-isoprenylcysteine O-methyltransferase Ste14
MTTSAGTLPRLPRWLVNGLLRPANWAPATFWLFLVFVQLAYAFQYPGVPTFGLVAINIVALFLFVTRRDASRVGALWEGVLAVAGTFVVSLLLLASNSGGATLHDAPPLPTAIQCAGIIGWGVSLAALGRSLGIAPADRGLVRHGPYRFIRHPIYAFEALFFLGWLVAYPTPGNAVILAAWAALQVARIVREERILGGYDEYRQSVRWRIIPFIW